MKRFIAISAFILTLLCPAPDAVAKADASLLKVHHLDVAVDEQAEKVTIDLTLNMASIKPGIDREVVFTPVMISAGATDSLELPEITVAGKNRYFWHVRNDDAEDAARVYRGGAKGLVNYSQTVDFEPWMGQSTVEMRLESATCCNSPERIDGPSRHGNVELAQIDTRRPDLLAEFVYMRPADAGPVMKQIEGKAFVSFVVNRTELKPDYMVNRREIAKILQSIDFVRNDSDATITHVHIKGFASPEGSYSNNVRLARGRTETLRRYVRDLYHFHDTTVTTSFDPEDWGGLRSYVKDSLNYRLENRAGILEIIDSNLEPDPKDNMLKQTYPADYQVILKEIYPWLRHSDYTVKYRIREYADINEIRRVFAADPTRLRLVDFYTLANTYEEGSPEYFEVFETAAKVYPDDPVANLNAANIAMQRGEYDLAQSRLLKTGHTPEAEFARGVLAACRGDYRSALELFETAKAGGIEAAGRYIDSVNAIRNHYPVKVTVEMESEKK